MTDRNINCCLKGKTHIRREALTLKHTLPSVKNTMSFTYFPLNYIYLSQITEHNSTLNWNIVYWAFSAKLCVAWIKSMFHIESCNNIDWPFSNFPDTKLHTRRRQVHSLSELLTVWCLDSLFWSLELNATCLMWDERKNYHVWTCIIPHTHTHLT